MDKAKCGCPTDGEFTYHQNSVCRPLPPSCPSCAALRARVAVLEDAMEWAKSTGGAIHDDQISSWLCELDRRAKEGK